MGLVGSSAAWVCVALAALGLAAETVEAPRANGPTPLAVEQAFEELRSGDWVLKWAAMSQLARWRVKEAEAPLKGILGGKDPPWVRGRALVALAELSGEAMLGEAQARAGDAAPELRAAAVEALGVLGTPKGEATIAARLKDPAPEVRYQAAVALARVRKGEAWETIAPLLDDKDPQLVQHAARALFYVARAEAHERAIALLAHADAGVRAEAAHTLGQARVRQAVPALLRGMAADGEAKVRFACEKALAGFSGQALFLPLLAALRGADARLYASALRVLAMRPVAEACEGVAALIRDADHPYREVLPEAFRLLSRIDPDRYQEVFAAHLSHPTAYVRVKAIESLGQCAKADQFRLLRPALTDKDQGVRIAAFRAIRNITDAAPAEGLVEYLAEGIREGDKWTHRAATDLLCERITVAELPRVVALMAPVLGGKDKTEREYIAKALARLGDDAARRRIAAAQGYVADWHLIGPFPYESRNRGYGPAWFPEHEIDFARDYPAPAADPTAVFRPGEVTCGGQKRKGLALQPPSGQAAGGKLVATFALELPEAKDLKLTLALGLEDTAADSDGVGFEAAVNGHKLLTKKLLKPEGWETAEASLADYAGKRIALELTVDPLGNPKDDRAAIADPRIVSGDQVLANLADLADAAPVRIAVADPKAPRLAWQRYRASRTDGEVSLYDTYPLPLDAKMVYGVADIVCAEEHKATLHVKSDDGFILWLNGVKVKERPGAGEDKAEVTLRQGPNRLLIKCFNLHEWWLYWVRLTTPDGAALPFRQDDK
ncbi:MAG: HEAT repeat domain-containing protein [Planctomycetes bacterium]|nr:HEAT repeat domain-containing protein [Planctomycetota bacterium]